MGTSLLLGFFYSFLIYICLDQLLYKNKETVTKQITTSPNHKKRLKLSSNYQIT